MTLDDIITQIRQKAVYAPSFGHTALFDFDEDGCVFLDGRESPPVISAARQDAEVTLATSLETFGKILSGESDPNIAFMMGRLKIRGSMGLALKLNAFLEG
jgi:putative sterol carrier protein